MIWALEHSKCAFLIKLYFLWVFVIYFKCHGRCFLRFLSIFSLSEPFHYTFLSFYNIFKFCSWKLILLSVLFDFNGKKSL